MPKKKQPDKEYRLFLTEIEKFYIQQNYAGMTKEDFIEKMPDILPDVIIAYVLNLPSPLDRSELPKKKSDQTIKERHEQIREKELKAGDFFDTTTERKNGKEDRPGVVKMTQNSAEVSDANYNQESPIIRHPDRITSLKRE